MLITDSVPVLENSDAQLVANSLSGNRDAFAEIVARYQTLICALAYSSTGSLAQSEDLAQETFLAAWKQLADLREPAKLRSWLCGIARNLTRRHQRGTANEPAHRAESLEVLNEVATLSQEPSVQAINREEETILWRSLERIPQNYREPLVLYYRQQASVERVAEVLELSPETVRQRLVRGRKLLQAEVVAFVEGTLERTNPGKTFTLGVIAALPFTAVSTKAATLGAAVATGSVTVKSAATLGTLGGALGIIGGGLITFKAKADETKSPRERRFFLSMAAIRTGIILGGLGILLLLKQIHFPNTVFVHDVIFAAVVFFLALAGTAVMEYALIRQMKIQMEEGTWDINEWTKPRYQTEASGTAHQKSKISKKTWRFMAFSIMLAAWMIVKTPWANHYLSACLRVLFWVSMVILGYGGWQLRPRYPIPPLGWVIGGFVFSAVITLWQFNVHQSAIIVGGHAELAEPSWIIGLFDSVVVALYIGCIGLFITRRKRQRGLNASLPAK